jgi:hypothetical protein
MAPRLLAWASAVKAWREAGASLGSRHLARPSMALTLPGPPATWERSRARRKLLVEAHPNLNRLQPGRKKRLRNKSFLVLFFKKELLSFYEYRGSSHV